MLDALLEIGSYADWITPLWAWINDVANAGGHTFLMPTENFPCAPVQVQQFLRSKGIKTYGLMIVGDHVLLSCHPGKARWTQYWLDRLGIWIEYGRV